MFPRMIFNLTLLSLLCASLVSAKFSFSREQLRQFDIRRRHSTMGPSNAYRPPAAVNTVTVTVSTTSTTTSTATTTSITTSQTTASTTITDIVTTGAVPPAVAQMHTTHIAILPRSTDLVSEKPRMRKVRRGGILSRRDEGGDTQSQVTIVIPPPEDMAALEQPPRRRVTDVDRKPLGDSVSALHDREIASAELSSGNLEKSATDATTAPASIINNEAFSAEDNLRNYIDAGSVTASHPQDAVKGSLTPLPGSSSSPLTAKVETSGTGTGTQNELNAVSVAPTSLSLTSHETEVGLVDWPLARK